MSRETLFCSLIAAELADDLWRKVAELKSNRTLWRAGLLLDDARIIAHLIRRIHGISRACQLDQRFRYQLRTAINLARQRTRADLLSATALL